MPAKIACFSSFQEEVEELLNDNKDLTSTSHAVRTLIEFVGTHLPEGKKWANYDDIGELMALVEQMTQLGALREAIENKLDNPDIGLLPSGRLGIDKDFQQRVLRPFSDARTQGKVLSHIEGFETKYVASQGKPDTSKGDLTEFNDAFKAEFGFTFTLLYQVTTVLTEEGFEKAESVVIRSEVELIKKITSTIEEIDEKAAKEVLDFLTLPVRDVVAFKNAENEFDKKFIPWRYNRPASYLRRPLVKVIRDDGNEYFYYGYRHLHVYLDHLLYLIFNAKKYLRIKEHLLRLR